MKSFKVSMASTRSIVLILTVMISVVLLSSCKLPKKYNGAYYLEGTNFKNQALVISDSSDYTTIDHRINLNGKVNVTVRGTTYTVTVNPDDLDSNEFIPWNGDKGAYDAYRVQDNRQRNDGRVIGATFTYYFSQDAHQITLKVDAFIVDGLNEDDVFWSETKTYRFYRSFI